MSALFARLRGSGHMGPLLASAAGVALGLIREVLIIGQLGLSAANDQLQIYLTTIYVISLLNEAVRLGSINLLQKRSLGQTSVSILPLGLLYALVASGFVYFLMRPASDLLMMGAMVSGWLNMVMILLVTQRQRSGRFWAAHLINLLPNLVLLPGVIAVWMMKLKDPVPILACLYFLLPVIQIALLLSVKPGESGEAPDAETTADRGVFVAHGVGALGGLLFQGVLRSTGLSTGEGVLALLSISIRMYDSVRFILVDTIIGRQLASWKASNNLNQAQRWIGKMILPQIIVASLALVATLLFGHQEGLRAWTALGVLVASVGAFGVRMIYYMVNTQAVSLRLVWQYGLQDLGVAAILGLASLTGALWPAMLIWVWYIAKPIAQLLTVRKNLHGLLANAQEARA